MKRTAGDGTWKGQGVKFDTSAEGGESSGVKNGELLDAAENIYTVLPLLLVMN